MSGGLAGFLMASGLLVLLVRSVPVAIGTVTAQSVVLVVFAFHEASSVDAVLAASVLGSRTVGLAVFLLFLDRRASEHGPIREGGSLPARLAVVAAMLVAWFVPAIGLPSDPRMRTAVALVASGLFVATRRPTLIQLLGVILMENGLLLATGPVLAGTHWFEIAATADLVIVACVAGVFHHRIVTEFESTDTGTLTGLRDEV